MLRHQTIDLQDVTGEGNYVMGTHISLYYFLQLHVIYNYLKIRSLILKIGGRSTTYSLIISWLGLFPGTFWM